MPLKRIVRKRLLTSKEANKYNKIRDQLDTLTDLRQLVNEVIACASVTSNCRICGGEGDHEDNCPVPLALLLDERYCNLC